MCPASHSRRTLSQGFQGARLHLGDVCLFDSTYSIDATKRPKEINLLGTEGDLAGKEALGVYLLEGYLLRICYVMPGQQRPEAFNSATGVFLRLNGVEPRPDGPEWEELVLAIAMGNLDREQATIRLRES